MRLRWVVACVLGEALGIAFVAVAYAAVDRGLVSAAPAAILGAGAWEGLCLGAAQALVLRRIAVRPVRWTALTAAGALLGYGLSLAGGAGGSAAGEPAAWLSAALGAGLGVVMGALLGGIQGIAARKTLPLRSWAVANTIGWAPAMAVIMLAANTAERAWPLHLIAVFGAGAGALAGLFVGIATGVVVSRAAAGGIDLDQRPAAESGDRIDPPGARRRTRGGGPP